MLEIWLTVCLIAQPAKCETVHVPFVQVESQKLCLRQSVFSAVRWSETHPGWRVVGLTCTMPQA